MSDTKIWDGSQWLAGSGGKVWDGTQWLPLTSGEGGTPPAEEGWTRPAEWLPTNVVAGEQKIQTLIALGGPSSPLTARQMTVLASGAFTVDWGDGTAPENFASMATAKHQYSGNGLTALGTGFQAMVTVTPQSGNLTLFDFSPPFDVGKKWRSPALELVTGPSTLTNLVIGNSSQSVSTTPNIHRIEFKSPVAANSYGLFGFCRNVREIIGTVNITTPSPFGMFNSCSSLKVFPHVNFTVQPTTLLQMFYNCGDMQEVPEWLVQADTSKVTDFGGMFNSCTSLTTVPSLNTVASTKFGGMFSGCASLHTIGSLDTSLGTDFANMFSGCSSLEMVPALNTANGTAFSSMFSGCSALESVPALNTNLGTSFNSMFYNCESLLRIEGSLNFAGGTSSSSFTSIFSNTYAIRYITFSSGPKYSFTINGMLDAATLNAIYTSLPTVTGQTITVTNIPGTLGDDPTIATAKGWTVTGS